MIQLEHTAQVWCIYGNLGGGKTLTAVSMAYHAMQQGYFVVSNVSLDIVAIERYIPNARQLYQHIVVRDDKYDDAGNLISSVDFNPFSIPSGSPRGHGGGKRVLVILDECAEWFDQYVSGKSPVVQRVMSWLRHSSKRSQDVVFVVQRRDYLNKSFRILVSRWIYVDDLAVWRIPVFKLHLPFFSDFCVALTYDKADNRVQPAKLIRKSVFGRFYDTAECLATYYGASAQEYDYVRPVRSRLHILIILWVASYFYLCIWYVWAL